MKYYLFDFIKLNKLLNYIINKLNYNKNKKI